MAKAESRLPATAVFTLLIIAMPASTATDRITESMIYIVPGIGFSRNESLHYGNKITHFYSNCQTNILKIA